MKTLALFIIFLSCGLLLAQDGSGLTRPRRVSETQRPANQPKTAKNTAPRNNSSFSASQILLRRNEAKRLLRSRPTAADVVGLALYDPRNVGLQLVYLPKSRFSQRGPNELTSASGDAIRLEIVRTNGVNSAMRAFTPEGRQLIPLLVKYPTHEFTVYYTPAHPSLVTPAVVQAGKTYLDKELDAAAKSLRAKGFNISPAIVNIARNLAIVEHTDVYRLRSEPPKVLVYEIYQLLALNEGDAFLLAGSSAAAYGLAQFIPSTYYGLRKAYPQAGLMPDFKAGMRNHHNALQATLIYLDDAWQSLNQRSVVRAALNEGQATQAELLAASYNAGTGRVPNWLQNGGKAWRTLLPTETKTYLKTQKIIQTIKL